METSLAYSLDICPNCGDFADLDDFTGWCADCSPQVARNSIPCNTCGEPVPISYGTTICSKCKREQWLGKYTDDIEFLMAYKGYSFSKARTYVAKIVQPICKCCGRPVKGGTPGETLFCKSNPRCHRRYRQYKRLLKSGLSQEEALREVTK